MTEQEQEESLFKRTYNIINTDFFILELGKHIALLLGCLIVIERMLEVYINLPSDIKMNIIFNIGYMFAVLSVPMALAGYYINEMCDLND